MLGIVASYIVALAMGDVSFAEVAKAKVIDLPNLTIAKFDASAIITIVPIALATMMEHIGDISVISATTGINYIAKPGLHRTLVGDGLATTLSAMFGGPANTTYGENTGVLALTKVYDPIVMEIAVVFAIILSLFPAFSAFISTIPTATIGGVSLILYGMISAIGIRNVVENHIDFTNSRNLIIAAVILVSAIGFNSMGGISFDVAGTTISLSGIAIAALSGIILNAILPGNDYDFESQEHHDELTFKLTVRNKGTSVYKNITVTEDINFNLSVIDRGGGILSNNKLTWNISTLNLGQDLKISYTLKVPIKKKLIGKIITFTGTVGKIDTSKIETRIGDKFTTYEKEQLLKSFNKLKSNTYSSSRSFIKAVYNDAFKINLGTDLSNNLNNIYYDPNAKSAGWKSQLLLKYTYINENVRNNLYNNYLGLRIDEDFDSTNNIVKALLAWNDYPACELNDRARTLQTSMLEDGDIIVCGQKIIIRY